MSPQGTDIYFNKIGPTVGRLGSSSTFEKNGLSLRQLIIDGSVQRDVLQSMRYLIPYFVHYFTLACYSGECEMYSTVHEEHYWPSMWTDAFDTSLICHGWSRLGAKPNYQRQLQLFLTSNPIEFIIVDIRDSIPRIKSANRFRIGVTHRYSKQTWAISKPRQTSTHVAQFFLKHWLVPYRILITVTVHNGQQFVNNCFIALCNYLSSYNITKTAYVGVL